MTPIRSTWRIVARRIWPEWDVLTAPDWVWELPGAEIATLRRMREVGAVITAQRRMSDAETLLLARVLEWNRLYNRHAKRWPRRSRTTARRNA